MQAFKIGIAICVIKVILPSMGKILANPMNIFNIFRRKFDFKLLSFLTGISGIFKVSIIIIF